MIALTVQKLMEKLREYPLDMLVILEDGGDGGGFNHANAVEKIKVSAFSNGRGSYYGELTEYEAEKADMTYKHVRHGDKEFKMFSSHFNAVLIKAG